MNLTVNQKIFIGIVAVVVWGLALAVHHLYPDVDVSGLITTAGATLAGLGVSHINDAAQAKVTNVDTPLVQAAAPGAAIPVEGADTATTKS